MKKAQSVRSLQQALKQADERNAELNRSLRLADEREYSLQRQLETKNAQIRALDEFSAVLAQTIQDYQRGRAVNA